MVDIGRYQERLRSLPPPGGNGCHVALLGAANLGILSGLSADQVFADLRKAVPPGKRPVPDREIMAAVNRAIQDHTAGESVYRRKPQPLVNDGAGILRKLIEQGKGATEADIREASPIRIDWRPEADSIHVLPLLYDADDLLFVGERLEPGIMSKTIRTCSEWVEHFSKAGNTAPHIITNPLNGQPAQKKDGSGPTFRGDGNVSVFRFCLIEFDNLSQEDQLAFWAAVNLPVAALIDSGGKSIHGWLDVRRLADVRTSAAWAHHIGGRLYSQVLEPLGVDSACKNPSRLSRLPGHLRAEKQRRQAILYLSPVGQRVF